MLANVSWRSTPVADTRYEPLDAEATQQVGFSGLRPHNIRDTLERVVALEMTAGIVDGFEIIDIENKKITGLEALAQNGADALLKGGAV